MSNIIHKVKDALHSDKTHEAPEGTHGPHSSRAANAADPRIDSDRDHRAAPTTHYGTEGTHARPHEGIGSTGGYNTAEGVHGPHSSRTANAADPRVDSDRDHRAAPGTSTFGSNTHTGTHGTSGLGSSTGAGYGSHNTSEGVHGPHGSRVANAADPRVDSDRDHRAAPGSSAFGSTTHGTHNTHSSGLTGSTGTYGSGGVPEGTHGPHGSRVANAADPRVDSDRDHRGTHATTHVGPAQNTAGPHKSDALNKIDPRVDSDLDGSKTLGQNKTHQY